MARAVNRRSESVGRNVGLCSASSDSLPTNIMTEGIRSEKNEKSSEPRDRSVLDTSMAWSVSWREMA